MEKSLTLYTWFSGILVVTNIVADILLLLKFRRYFRANGCGFVTLTLASFLFANFLGALIFGMTSLTVVISGGKSYQLFYAMNNLGTVWTLTTSLMHIACITFQRLFSLSCGRTFLNFTLSKTNIAISLTSLWIAALIIAMVCITSKTPETFTVYYFGIIATGLLSVFNFSLTLDTPIFKIKEVSSDFEDETMNASDQNLTKSTLQLKIVHNPRKTISLFSGLVFSFSIFCLPPSIPNLVFNLRGKLMSPTTSLIISLWILLGILCNSIWILLRLRSTINDATGFYAKWNVRKSRENIVHLIRRTRKSNRNSMILQEEDDYLNNFELDDTQQEML